MIAMIDFSFSTKQNNINPIQVLAFDTSNILLFLIKDTKINLQEFPF